MNRRIDSENEEHIIPGKLIRDFKIIQYTRYHKCRLNILVIYYI